MTDHFAVNVHALLNATRDVGTTGATAPSPSDCRYISRIAGFVSCQRNSPFVDHTYPQILAIDFADAALAWAANPTNREKTVDLYYARITLLDSLALPPAN